MRSFGKEQKRKLLLCALLVKSERAIALVRSFSKEQESKSLLVALLAKSKRAYCSLSLFLKERKHERANERMPIVITQPYFLDIVAL